MSDPTPYDVALFGLDQRRLERLGALFGKAGYRVLPTQLPRDAALPPCEADAVVLDTWGRGRLRPGQTHALVLSPILVTGTHAAPWPDEQQLVLRVAVQCRRSRMIEGGLRTLGVNVLPEHRTVSTDAGTEAVLSPVEFGLLRGIVMGAGEVVSRDRLVRLAWHGPRRIAHSTLDSHIRGVRAKLRAAGVPLRIRTCRGLGYAWVLPA
jgi:hypothetical protein